MDAADKKIGAYSKGMRQRVKLAQAIVHDPQLLILDEPLAGMDPLARRRTIRMIRDWARAGRSVIVSSHILHEIESMTGEHPADQQRPDSRRRRRPPDPRSHRRASAYGVSAGRGSARPGARVPGLRRRPQPEVRRRARWSSKRGSPTCSIRSSRKWPPAASSARSTRSRRPTTTCGGVPVPGEVVTMRHHRTRTPRPRVCLRRALCRRRSISRSTRCCGRAGRSSWGCWWARR